MGRFNRNSQFLSLVSIRILRYWLPRKIDSQMVTWNVLSFHSECRTWRMLCLEHSHSSGVGINFLDSSAKSIIKSNDRLGFN